VAERRAFQRLARELCEDVCDTYDRAADEPVAPLRERALRLIDSIRKHLQALDETADPYGRIRTSLGELLSGVEALVSWLGLERVAERPVAADAVARLGQALGREEEALPRVLAGEDEFAADEDDEDAEEELPPPEHAYELRIELMGIEPPVWRCLRVAGDMSLGDLHWVIQVAMGWEFDHAHEFVVDRESYGPVADGFEGLDEDEVTLDELNLRRGRKFMYTYDFGDDWRHLLRVEKVLPPTPEDLQTACFAGGRACPPEDCGGVGGYYRILEALANPDDPEFADLREWVGDEYDPARFDLEAVQQRLAKAFTTEAD
jgi:hypothetical protein